MAAGIQSRWPARRTCDLEDAEVVAMMADDLNADRQTIGGRRGSNRRCG
jgi:hypothetical protein